MTFVLVATVSFLAGMLTEWLLVKSFGFAAGREDSHTFWKTMHRAGRWRIVAIVLVGATLIANSWSVVRLVETETRLDRLQSCQQHATQDNIDLWVDLRALIVQGPSSPAETDLLKSIDTYLTSLQTLQEVRGHSEDKCQP